MLRFFRFFFFIICCHFSYVSTQAQVYGCMDPSSSNYNPAATISNGSCIYPDGSVTLKNLRKAILPNTLHEISGMILIGGKLYGHNDSRKEPAIYEFDTTSGNITKTITLQGATNIDWEDITQDDAYVYVGDFGNNVSGDRTNLKIYRFPKQGIANISGLSGVIPSSDIDVINFKYEDQTDFKPCPPDSTRYDCEALIYDQDKLHLFTKNWISNYTVHYVINATPTQDVQVAMRKDSFNTNGIAITSATRLNYKTSVLLGYQVTGVPSGFMFIISGYNNMTEIFTSGNKRKINLGGILDGINTGIGQVEGITVANAERVFISNENFSNIFTVPQSFYGLNIGQWLPSYIVLATGITDLTAIPADGKILINWRFDEEQFDHFEVESSSDGIHFSVAGKVINGIGIHKYKFADNNAILQGPVFYRIKVIMNNGEFNYSKIISVNANQTKHFDLKVSPSPFQQTLHLSIYSDREKEIILNMVDLNGKKIQTKKWSVNLGDNHYEWKNLSFLPRSIYYITAQSGDELLVKKIVKN